jgi:hypothetical protein
MYSPVVIERGGIVITDPEWRQKYTEALLELRPEELPRRIEVALKAIEQRARKLEPKSDISAEEQRAIDDAVRMLRVLADKECTTRAHWPDSDAVSPKVTP